MRLFQEIEGAEVIYINTYAATTPRLAAFKNICSNNSKEPELVEFDLLKTTKTSKTSISNDSSYTYNSESTISQTDDEESSDFDFKAEVGAYFEKQRAK